MNSKAHEEAESYPMCRSSSRESASLHPPCQGERTDKAALLEDYKNSLRCDSGDDPSITSDNVPFQNRRASDVISGYEEDIDSDPEPGRARAAHESVFNGDSRNGPHDQFGPVPSRLGEAWPPRGMPPQQGADARGFASPPNESNDESSGGMLPPPPYDHHAHAHGHAAHHHGGGASRPGKVRTSFVLAATSTLKHGAPNGWDDKGEGNEHAAPGGVASASPLSVLERRRRARGGAGGGERLRRVPAPVMVPDKTPANGHVSRAGGKNPVVVAAGAPLAAGSSVDVSGLFGADLRSLALFRALLAVCILVDCWMRLGSARALMTDQGVLPREALLRVWPSTPWCLHLLSGSSTMQVCAIFAAALTALLLLVGHRTRLMTFLCWLLLTSTQLRNPLVVDQQDHLLRLLLFWGWFLPLGGAYSVDAAMSRPISCRASPRILTCGTVALVLQVVLRYYSSALLKSGTEWTETGSALQLMLAVLCNPGYLARFLQSLPPSLLAAITRGVLWWEALGPSLLLVGGVSGALRCVVCTLFCGHTLLMVTCSAGSLLGTLVGVATIAPFLPTSLWVPLSASLKTPERLALRMFYDAENRASHVLLLVMRTFFLIPETLILPAQKNTTVFADMEAQHARWALLVDSKGKHHVGWAAARTLFAHSPFLFALRPLLSLAESLAGVRLLRALVGASVAIARYLLTPDGKSVTTPSGGGGTSPGVNTTTPSGSCPACGGSAWGSSPVGMRKLGLRAPSPSLKWPLGRFTVAVVSLLLLQVVLHTGRTLLESTGHDLSAFTPPPLAANTYVASSRQRSGCAFQSYRTIIIGVIL
eukprot:jgi/Mesvir1/3651/Mv14945-RA.2